MVEQGISATADGEFLSEGQKKAIEDLKLKDLKAKNYFFQAIDRPTLETILKKDTGYLGLLETKVPGNGSSQMCTTASSSQRVGGSSDEDGRISVRLLCLNFHNC